LVLVVLVVLEHQEVAKVVLVLLEEILPLDLLDLLILVNQITSSPKAVEPVVVDNHRAAAVMQVVLAVLEVDVGQVTPSPQDQQLNQELIHLPLSLTMEIMEVQGHHRLVPLLEGEVLVAVGQVLMLLQEIHLDLVVMDNHSQHLHLQS
jgi:hypothetical protein